MNNEVFGSKARFKELVESFIDGSITEAQSKELLEMVKSDEALRTEFAGQLQVSGMLRCSTDKAGGSVENAVLAGLNDTAGESEPESSRAIRWNTVFIRAAAVLAVAFVVSQYVDFGGRKKSVVTVADTTAVQGVTNEIPSERAGHPVESVETVPAREDAQINAPAVQVQDPVSAKPAEAVPEAAPKPPPAPATGSPDPVPARPAEPVPAPAPKPKPMVKSPEMEPLFRTGAADRNESVKEVQRMVPLKIETPRPQFTGTPKDIRSANLESSGEKRARDGYYSLQQSSAGAMPKIMPTPILPPSMPPAVPSGESYARIEENEFQNSVDKPLSTFSIDVDTASYSNLRRMLNSGQLPPADAVRIEEMINYFEYNYEGPVDEKPFSTALSMHLCPWNGNHHLLRVGIQGRRMDERERRPSNLVFLLDVSGSMNSYDKLPLLKTGMSMLVKALSENDRVAIVVYAGSTGLVLDSTSAAEKGRIIEAMERLSAGGSTAGGAGIELAYRVAQDNFIKGGINRVILATDGDFNVGVSSHDGLEKLIEAKRSSGVFLSVLGFGTGNLQDSKMELLANKGNGNYFYIDSEREAEKVLVRQLNATLTTIAKDVKIQVEFNPGYVKSYRLIGYENRRMAARDFDDDKKDAGEIGAGHQVTALYEIVPVGAPDAHDGVPLKYARREEKRPEPESGEMLTVKLRYKEPDGDTSRLLEFPYTADDVRNGKGDDSFRWAAAVAAFGQVLRNSQHVGRFTLNDARALAAGARGEDSCGYRAEFINLIDRAAALKGEEPPKSEKGYPLWQYRN